MKDLISQENSSDMQSHFSFRRLFSSILPYFIRSLSSLGKKLLRLADLDLDMDFSKIKAHQDRMTKDSEFVAGETRPPQEEAYDEMTEFKKKAWSIDRAWEDGQMEALSQEQFDANVAKEKKGGEVR